MTSRMHGVIVSYTKMHDNNEYYLKCFPPQVTTNVGQLPCQWENTQVKHELQRKPCICLTIFNLVECHNFAISFITFEKNRRHSVKRKAAQCLFEEITSLSSSLEDWNIRGISCGETSLLTFFNCVSASCVKE